MGETIKSQGVGHAAKTQGHAAKEEVRKCYLSMWPLLDADLAANSATFKGQSWKWPGVSSTTIDVATWHQATKACEIAVLQRA